MYQLHEDGYEWWWIFLWMKYKILSPFAIHSFFILFITACKMNCEECDYNSEKDDTVCSKCSSKFGLNTGMTCDGKYYTLLCLKMLCFTLMNVLNDFAVLLNDLLKSLICLIYSSSRPQIEQTKKDTACKTPFWHQIYVLK